MRWPFLLLVVTVGGCSGRSADPGPASGSFSGAGRDRLCIAGDGETWRAGIIVYGAGDVNCSAVGALVRDGAGHALVPQGEGGCRIGLAIAGDAARVTSVPAACDFYCAPGASLSKKVFRRDWTGKPATDFAGDSLC